MYSDKEMTRSSVRDVVSVLFQHKWKIAILWLLVSATVTVMTYAAREVYESEAKLLIKLGRESVSLDPTVSGPTIGISQNRESEVNSELAILKSRYLAEYVVDTLGEEILLSEPDETPGANEAIERLREVRRRLREAGDARQDLMVSLDFETELKPYLKAVNRVMNNLSVSVEKKSNVINVTYAAQSPRIAQQTLSALLSSFLDRHIAIHSTQASPEFFEEQANELMSKLTEREQALHQFRQDHAIASIERQTETLLQEISDLYLEQYIGGLENAASQMASTEARVQTLEAATANRSRDIELQRVSGVTNPAADALVSLLANLRNEEIDLSSRYEDSYRPLVAVRRQIASTEADLKEGGYTRTTVTSGLDSNLQVLELMLEKERANYAGLQARQASLKAELTFKKDKLAELSRHDLEHNKLEREVGLLETEYIDYRDNLRRARISNALDLSNVSNVSIIQPATLPLGPARPNKPLNLALGVVLGLLMGVGFAFFLHYLDDSFKTNEDVRKQLALPVLAAVSLSEFKKCI